ncbi:putative zinc ribbon protein [Serratia fonticola]
MVRKADWQCACGSHYHGERYCLSCCTGAYSVEVPVKSSAVAGGVACAC